MIKTFFLSHNDELMPCLQGEGILETWNKNETKEIIKLGVKFGKIVPSRNKCPTLNQSNLPSKCVAPNPTFAETRVRPIP
jgi:hypothetical protein